MLYVLADNARKSGKADANVYTVRGVIRRWVKGSNPRTEAQTDRRAIFATQSTDWNTALDDDQRAGWRAISIPGVNRVGLPVTITGKDLFVALNSNLASAEEAQILDAPLPVGVSAPSIASLTMDVSDSNFKIAFATSPVPANTAYLIYAAGPFSVGTNAPSQSRFRLVKVLAAASTSEAQIWTEYSAIFGTPVAGIRAFVQMKAINTNTGYASSIVGATGVFTA